MSKRKSIESSCTRSQEEKSSAPGSHHAAPQPGPKKTVVPPLTYKAYLKNIGITATAK